MAITSEHWYLLRIGADTPLCIETQTERGIRVRLSATEPYSEYFPSSLRVDIFIERDVDTTAEQDALLAKMYDESIGAISFRGLTVEERSNAAWIGQTQASFQTLVDYCDCLTWTMEQQVRVHCDLDSTTVQAGSARPVLRGSGMIAPLRMRPNGFAAGTVAQMTGAYPIDRRATAGELGAALKRSAIGLPDPVRLFLEVDAIKWEMQSSAVVMLCACAEWAVKEGISVAHPDTAWLLQEMQSPTIAKMLKHYWPEFASEDRNRIRIAFDARNAIVHGSKTLKKNDKVVSVNDECRSSFDSWQASVRMLLRELYPAPSSTEGAT